MLGTVSPLLEEEGVCYNPGRLAVLHPEWNWWHLYMQVL